METVGLIESAHSNLVNILGQVYLILVKTLVQKSYSHGTIGTTLFQD